MLFLIVPTNKEISGYDGVHTAKYCRAAYVLIVNMSLCYVELSEDLQPGNFASVFMKITSD